ncbi:MAG: hypothetical protein M3082_02280 [Candidatus Dormibacteraeota bacterium]|nr:hypothetical protein [Candidatus Dormibacteraeota bacterium]
MNGWQFAASVIGSVAWPTAVVLLVVLFRRSVRQLLTGDVKRWKAGPSGLEVEFQESLSEIRQEVQKIPESGPEGPAAPAASAEGANSLRQEMLEVAKRSPRAAVLESFDRLEALLRERLEASGLETRRLPTLGAPGLADLARLRGLIPPETETAVNGLTVLRNLAAHDRDSDLSYQKAVEFIDLVVALLFAIEHPPKGK